MMNVSNVSNPEGVTIKVTKLIKHPGMEMWRNESDPKSRRYTLALFKLKPDESVNLSYISLPLPGDDSDYIDTDMKSEMLAIGRAIKNASGHAIGPVEEYLLRVSLSQKNCHEKVHLK